LAGAGLAQFLVPAGVIAVAGMTGVFFAAGMAALAPRVASNAQAVGTPSSVPSA
jgi:hypothetical protein